MVFWFLAATKQLYEWFSPSVDGNYRSRKITARRWLHKYVGAECGASSFTWYLNQMCNADVRLSVCPSHLFLHVPIIVSSWNFQELSPMTKVMSMQKIRGQRSRSQLVTTQLNRFRTVTPVWIHIWWWNDAYSLMLLRSGALLFLKVIRQISRSHGSKNCRIWPKLGVSGL